jgi:CheY-like chemotaxis protein
MSAPHRALVVDDDAAIRILVSRVLARKGFEVDSARDGAEAIEKMLQHDYAVVTLDLMMPRIDGVAVVRYLVQHKPEKLGNVIVMTAFGASVLEKVCPPVARFIEKPFDIETLVTQALECSEAATAIPSEDTPELETDVDAALAVMNAAEGAPARQGRGTRGEETAR